LARTLAGLTRAIGRRDPRFVHHIAAPDIRLDFGDALRLGDLRLHNRDAPAWDHLAKAISAGCSQVSEDVWECPGLMRTDPARNGIQIYDQIFLPGEGIPVRAAPARDAPVIARLVCEVVSSSPDRKAPPDWTEIRLADGRRGFVASRSAYSPLGYRVTLERRKQGWRMTAFLAGD
jgi:hypothetical protein